MVIHYFTPNIHTRTFLVIIKAISTCERTFLAKNQSNWTTEAKNRAIFHTGQNELSLWYEKLPYFWPQLSNLSEILAKMVLSHVLMAFMIDYGH